MLLTLSLLHAFAAETPSEDPLATHASVHVLDNGLTVVLEESHRTDTVALHISYAVGSFDELEGYKGCAHLFEHLMFEGSKNVPTNAFDGWLTDAGGWNNAFTSNDETAYYMSFPSGALDLALFLESDRLGFLNAGLTEENVLNQQSVVLQERATGYEGPHGRDWDALGKVVYPEGHPYRSPVIGTVADIEAFEVARVKSFWDAHYRPKNAILGLVGNFDSEEALEKIEHWFSDVPDRGEAAPRPTVPETLVRTPTHGLLEDDVEDRTLYIAFPGVKMRHEDEPALELLSSVLSGGRGTRLDDALYYDKPLTRDIFAYADTGYIDGAFIVAGTTHSLPLKKLEKKILSELARLEEAPPTESELHRARMSLYGAWQNTLESPLDRAEALVDCTRLTQDPNCQVADWARYEAVTTDDLLRVARTYLVPEKRSTLSVIPRGRASWALKGATPVELP